MTYPSIEIVYFDNVITKKNPANSEVNFYMGNLAHNNLDTGTTGHRVSFKCCDPVSLLILKDRKRIKA
ncbi:TPA: hypothetical protein HMP84_19575 [Escherichia coli]|nr:hypothetical protein [Salmonella enterica subsp. enterica serovar Heidelberg]HAJ2482784.1 hypothetical protein [Escherichia coli]